ncbi:hypothetical protein F7725_001173 [Dissostichus mawsoni]|uniref:Olfactomedin-like domain-containing protein n=1 Tax=Dissostichus mawsoni TaxID=36200 RepID=A0A7J5ZKL4_DISMA|nr:hypothetical protein F7725_001173 [Dissostichus mawsoni]
MVVSEEAPLIYFPRRYGAHASLKYNPEEKQLYGWDDGYQIIYRLTMKRKLLTDRKWISRREETPFWVTGGSAQGLAGGRGEAGALAVEAGCPRLPLQDTQTQGTLSLSGHSQHRIQSV